MKLLAIETATDACSVAFQWGEALVERSSNQPRAHAGLVLEMIQECLGESALELSDLDALVFGLSLIHISEPTRLDARSRMPSSA